MLHELRLRNWPANAPHPLLEELLGIVASFGLHVLRKGECHGAGLGLVREHAHGGEGGRHYLLGALDPVEVAGDGPEAVVDGEGSVVGGLELLQDGVGAA